MSYNSDSLNFHSTAPDTAGELAEFSFVNQQQVIYHLNHQANDILQVTDRWGMVPQPGPTTASPTSLPGFNSVAGATTYSRRLDGYAQPSFTDPSWPAMSQPPHPGYAGFSGWGAFPASRAMAPGSPTVISTPSSAPLHYWGENRSGPLVSTFDQNVNTSSQPMSGPTRTGQTSTRRFQPYGTSRARVTEHQNAEADPLATKLVQVPHVGPPTPQPTGGLIPETTADAEQDQTDTEEQEVPEEPKRARLRNGKGAPRPGREQEQDDFETLCRHVRNWRREGTPTRNQALTHVLEYIKTVRREVYPFPCLKTGRIQPCPDESAPHSRSEWVRRDTERRLMGQLSQFYHRRPQDRFWSRPLLLKEVLMDLEVRYRLPGLPDPSGPRASTSAEVL